MIAELTKQSIEEGNYSLINSGYSVTGSLSVVQINKEGIEVVPINSLDDIKVGEMVLVVKNQMDFLKTSPIKTIVSNNGLEMFFKTTTSIYRLAIVDIQ